MAKTNKKDIEMYFGNRKFKVRVLGIIIHDNNVLVESFDDGVYLFPGGHVEIDETTSEAAKRELKEEVQKRIKIIKLLGTAENFYVNNKLEYTHCLEYYYLATVNVKNHKDFSNSEIDFGNELKHHYKWIKISDLSDYNIKPEFITKKIMSDDLNELFHVVLN